MILKSIQCSCVQHQKFSFHSNRSSVIIFYPLIVWLMTWISFKWELWDPHCVYHHIITSKLLFDNAIVHSQCSCMMKKKWCLTVQLISNSAILSSCHEHIEHFFKVFKKYYLLKKTSLTLKIENFAYWYQYMTRIHLSCLYHWPMVNSSEMIAIFVCLHSHMIIIIWLFYPCLYTFF